MRLKVKPKPKARPRPPAPPKELTIKEAREKYELGSMERTVAELKELRAFADRARELQNATNRQKTQAGKAMKAAIAEGLLDTGDEICVEDVAYAYDVALHDAIDREAFYGLIAKGKITLETFLKCVYINKDMATKLVGEHILDGITAVEKGKKLDIRKRDLDTPIQGVKIVPKPLPKSKRLRRETDEPPVVNVNKAGFRVRRRRFAHVGRS